MSNSKLVNYTLLTNHMDKGRGGKKIDKIFVHHMAGNLTVETCGNVFKTRHASAHYGIGADGRVGQYVLEENTAWHCGNFAYNQRSIGIECANNGGASSNWSVSDKTIAKLIELLADICKRNGISKLNYTGDLSGNLCMHCWTMATACPGGYLKGKFKYIATEVNKKLAESKKEPTPNADTKAENTVPKKGEKWKIVRDKGLYMYDKPSKKGNKIMRLDKGTVFTVHDVKVGDTSCFAKLKKSNKYGWVLIYDKNGVYCKKKDNPKPSGTYRVTFNANGGTGEMTPQDFPQGKSAKLKANTFKRSGYQFVGWSDEKGKPVISGTDVPKFKNVDMVHFQLGKVKFKDKASVEPTKDTTLYAVWKGVGARAAVDWAKLIAKDNNFNYGTSPTANQWGCYFCDSNKFHKPVKKRGDKWDKTYCCNTFVHAAFAHGTNNKAMIDACDQRHSRKWGIAYSPTSFGIKGTKYEGIWNTSSYEWVKVSKKSELKVGDVLTYMNSNGSGHTWLYIGDGKIVEASGGGWSSKSISIKNKTNQDKADYVFRYKKK